uniref:Chemokine interleukin-8-like domain-containing protein n=1 Tax=Sparus aurata TaxID=8175 RepID=A0A671YE09_SPAAU
MANCGSLLKSALVAVVLVAVIHSALAVDEKLASCCKRVDKTEIKEPITGFMVQERNLPCVKAVIFQTKSGLFCKQFSAPWVHRKIVEYMKSKALASPSPVVPSSTASLLSIITSTASPASSSTPSSSPPSSSPPLPSSSLPSLPSTSEAPAGETFSSDE